MNFDIHKYDNVRFHKTELTHKRIKALLLTFEYQVYEHELPLDAQIILLKNWVDSFVIQEYYEVIPFFKDMLKDMTKRLEDGDFE